MAPAAATGRPPPAAEDRQPDYGRKQSLGQEDKERVIVGVETERRGHDEAQPVEKPVGGQRPYQEIGRGQRQQSEQGVGSRDLCVADGQWQKRRKQRSCESRFAIIERLAELVGHGYGQEGKD